MKKIAEIIIISVWIIFIVDIFLRLIFGGD